MARFVHLMSAKYFKFEQGDWSQTQPKKHRYYPGVQNDDESYAIKVDFDGGSKKGRLLVVGLHDGNLMKNRFVSGTFPITFDNLDSIFFIPFSMEAFMDNCKCSFIDAFSDLIYFCKLLLVIY